MLACSQSHGCRANWPSIGCNSAGPAVSPAHRLEFPTAAESLVSGLVLSVGDPSFLSPGPDHRSAVRPGSSGRYGRFERRPTPMVINDSGNPE